MNYYLVRKTFQNFSFKFNIFLDLYTELSKEVNIALKLPKPYSPLKVQSNFGRILKTKEKRGEGNRIPCNNNQKVKMQYTLTEPPLAY